MSILALETSCDDTCAAVIDADGRMRANVISSQGSTTASVESFRRSPPVTTWSL